MMQAKGRADSKRSRVVNDLVFGMDLSRFFTDEWYARAPSLEDIHQSAERIKEAECFNE
jgi:hypothetical protein